uniref:adenine phosphoribosyltransferase n=1 Tax=Astyanax mexicanus TaxID=7994 RepID=A0A8B9GQ74_ASTMX
IADISNAEKLELVAQSIRSFPDFPSKGILFWDICPILKDPRTLTAVTDLFEEHVRKNFPQVELIVGKTDQRRCSVQLCYPAESCYPRVYLKIKALKNILVLEPLSVCRIFG